MRDTQREKQRHRQREKQTPHKEPNGGLHPDPGIRTWAEGRCSTPEPSRRTHFLFSLKMWRYQRSGVLSSFCFSFLWANLGVWQVFQGSYESTQKKVFVQPPHSVGFYFFIFKNILFIYSWETQREREREREAETQAEGEAVSYTHLTLPTKSLSCRSRWSPYH